MQVLELGLKTWGRSQHLQGSIVPLHTEAHLLAFPWCWEPEGFLLVHRPSEGGRFRDLAPWAHVLPSCTLLGSLGLWFLTSPPPAAWRLTTEAQGQPPSPRWADVLEAKEASCSGSPVHSNFDLIIPYPFVSFFSHLRTFFFCILFRIFSFNQERVWL